MTTTTFYQKLQRSWSSNQSMLMVGLDPDLARFPKSLPANKQEVLTFCKAIVDATAPYVCGFKPQIAYFSAIGAETQLEAICDYIRSNYPQLCLVLDAKRGDIGSTAQQYAREAFERYQADAVTLNPYMGFDSIEPYLAWEDKGLIVLCRTSNPSGSDFQFIEDKNGLPLYLRVAQQVVQWNQNQQFALVVGATYPKEIAKVRQYVGDMPLLIPGIGAQGGDVAATVAAGRDSQGWGMMINSGRAILYASNKADWQEAAARASEAAKDAINAARKGLALGDGL